MRLFILIIVIILQYHIYFEWLYESDNLCCPMSLFLQGAVAALHMVHCFHLAGFPKGLISCVTGKGSEIGDFLTMHPGVNCIR